MKRSSPATPPVAASTGLAAGRDLLESVPGVGRRTATAILARLPAVERLPIAQPAAACRVLSPREFASGTSVRKRARLSKAGNPRLRKTLFLPAQTAARFTPILGGFFDRLVAAGKPKMQTIGACTRELVMICYGVLKNRTPFDPNWASRKTR